MTKKLFWEAILKFTLGAVLVGALIFLSAGTLDFPGGWLLMCILFIPMFCAGLVMMAKDPNLLKSRLKARESHKEQDTVIKLSGLMFIAGFVIAGLDHRFGWLPLPDWVARAAAVLFLIAYLLYGEVLRENAYLSRTIEVQEGQKVIDSGLYGIIRHPMYSATLLMFLSMPLVLGSLLSFAVFLFYPVLIVRRLLREEDMLEAELQGYTQYKKKVRYRLIPYIW